MAVGQGRGARVEHADKRGMPRWKTKERYLSDDRTPVTGWREESADIGGEGGPGR